MAGWLCCAMYAKAESVATSCHIAGGGVFNRAKGLFLCLLCSTVFHQTVFFTIGGGSGKSIFDRSTWSSFSRMMEGQGGCFAWRSIYHRHFSHGDQRFFIRFHIYLCRDMIAYRLIAILKRGRMNRFGTCVRPPSPTQVPWIFVLRRPKAVPRMGRLKTYPAFLFVC